MRTLGLFAFSALLSAPRGAERSLDLNFGFAPSKSALGVSYTVGKNQINIGLKEFWFQGSSGYAIRPGVTYNRSLSENGFYGSLTYAPVYRNREVAFLKFTGPDAHDYVVESRSRKGWTAGDFFLGGGKSFQFAAWGIHADAGLVTPASRDFAADWGGWLGAGVSYRFKLD